MDIAKLRFDYSMAGIPINDTNAGSMDGYVRMKDDYDGIDPTQVFVTLGTFDPPTVTFDEATVQLTVILVPPFTSEDRTLN